MTSEKVPGSHSAQIVEPEAFAKDPAGHGVQLEAPEPLWKKPGSHKRQSVTFRVPSLAVYDPGGHRLHADAFLTSLYVPIGHMTHVVRPGTGANVPGSHRGHSTVAGWDAADPAEQFMQEPLLLPPAKELCVPAGHCTHAAEVMAAVAAL